MCASGWDGHFSSRRRSYGTMRPSIDLSRIFSTVRSCFFLAVQSPLDVRSTWEKGQASLKLQVRSVSGRSQIVHPFIRITKDKNTLFSQTHFRNWQRLCLFMIFFTNSIFYTLSFSVWKGWCLKPWSHDFVMLPKYIHLKVSCSSLQENSWGHWLGFLNVQNN